MSDKRESHNLTLEDGTWTETWETQQKAHGLFGGEEVETWRRTVKTGPDGFSDQSIYSRKPAKD